MKNKKTLKQKIALSICAVSGFAIVGGFTLFSIGSVKKNDNVEEFKNSTEYRQLIEQELSDAELKYQASEPTLESLEEYYNASTAIYSIGHAENLLKNGNGEASKKYHSNVTLRNAGTIMFGSGLATLAVAGTMGFPISKKKENAEQKTEITK